MAHDSRRPDRVAEAIRTEVATFLATDAKDPRIQGLVTVTSVEITRDLRHATVYVSILGSDTERQATLDGLASLAGHLRSPVGRNLRLRLAPEIVFKYDESVARAARINELLGQIKHPAEPADAPADARAEGGSSD